MRRDWEKGGVNPLSIVGEWSKISARERGKLMYKLADLMEAHKVRWLNTQSSSNPISLLRLNWLLLNHLIRVQSTLSLSRLILECQLMHGDIMLDGVIRSRYETRFDYGRKYINLRERPFPSRTLVPTRICASQRKWVIHLPYPYRTLSFFPSGTSRSRCPDHSMELSPYDALMEDGRMSCSGKYRSPQARSGIL